jgi:hypothetical protein
MMAAPTKIDVSDLIDKNRTTSFQVRVLGLCTLCLLMDGYDLQALAYVAPVVVQDFKIPNAALGPIFGVANVGLLIGTVLFGMLGDRIGRRPVLIGATVFFAVVTLFTARATAVQELLVLRFLAGIGYGSVIPNVTALVGEYSPQRKRSTAIMMMTTLGHQWWRHDWWLRFRMVDSHVRMGFGVLRRWCPAACRCGPDGLPATGIGAVPGSAQQKPGKGRAVDAAH